MSTIRATMTRRLLGEASGPLAGIYVVTHRKTGKRYVGQSVSIATRWGNHLSGQGNSPKLAAALRKHGPDAFAFEIVELCARQELDDREAFYIWGFDCLSPKGYNLTSGGGQAQCYTAEARAKLSSSLRSSDNFKAAMRRLRADPDVQARRLEASRRSTATPEWKKDNREKMARLRDDPQWRASSTEQLSRIRANPETEARRLAGLRRVHSDPSFQARRIEAIRNSEAVRRAHSDPTTYAIINIKTGERDTGTRLDFRGRHGISSTCFGDLLRGKQKTARGWRLALPEEL